MKFTGPPSCLFESYVLSAGPATYLGRSAGGGVLVALRADPVSILTADGGTLELAVDGDVGTARAVLKRVAARFGGTVTRHVRRQFFDRE